MASLLLYGSAVADATVTTACDMATATGGVETSKTTTLTGGAKCGEVTSQGGSVATVATVPTTPTGKGWVYKPGAGTFSTANWSAVANLACASLATSPQWQMRFFKYNGSTYTSIGTITITITATAKTSYTFTATSMGTVTLGASDYVYVDLWYVATTSANSCNPVVYESTTTANGVAGDMAVTTSNFTPTASPVLATSPTTLSFSSYVGGASPATQNDTLSETAGVGTAWTSAISYGSGSGWLGIAASSGTLSASGNATIVYTCTTGALAAGTYTATVTYTATTGGATATVGVTFVVATAPALGTSPSTLSFSATVGGASPSTQNDTLSNTGATSSAWTSAISYGAGSGWLGIAASSGTLAGSGNATIVFTCTTGSLAVGTYTATVTYTATTGGSTATVVVTFVINHIAYNDYKVTILPNLIAALSAKSLLNAVQVIGPDTTSASDVTWLEQASIDIPSSLAGYVRHAFPPGAADISNDSREVAAKAVVGAVYTNDNTAKPIIQGEMGFGNAGPGQSVALYQYGVDMADYAVQLARAGMAALIAYDLDDDMHGTQWGMWQITTDTGQPRPWFFPWSLLSNTLVIGSTLYAPAQPASNDFRCLAATSPQGFWTVVLINRKSIAQNVQVIVPFAPVVTTTLATYTYSQATPLLVDTNGFPLASGSLTVVLQRGFTTSIAPNSVLILTQNGPSSSVTPPVGPGLPGPPPIGATTLSTIDVKRPPLARRR